MNHPDIPKQCVSGAEELRFLSSVPSSGAPYAFRLEGTSYGVEWSVNVTRDGLKMLIE